MGFFKPNVEKMKARKDIKGLIKTLGYEKDLEVRKAAAEALGKIGEPAIEPLTAALKEEDKNVRKAAAEALGKIGEPAIEPLTAALKEEDKNVRETAAGVLRKIDKEVSELIDTIDNIWASERTRKAAEKRVVRIGGKLAIKPLVSLLKKREIAVRESALTAIRSMTIELPPKTVELVESASIKYEKDMTMIQQEIKPLNSLLVSVYSWGEKHGFTTYEKYPQYEKIHAIGEKINRIGGHSGMWIPYYTILYNNRMVAGILEGMWDGIGSWQR